MHSFQIYSIILWMCENYYYYAIAIAVTGAFSVVDTLISTRAHLVQLSNMAHYACPVTCLRDGKFGAPRFSSPLFCLSCLFAGI